MQNSNRNNPRARRQPSRQHIRIFGWLEDQISFAFTEVLNHGTQTKAQRRYLMAVWSCCSGGFQASHTHTQSNHGIGRIKSNNHTKKPVGLKDTVLRFGMTTLHTEEVGLMGTLISLQPHIRSASYNTTTRLEYFWAAIKAAIQLDTCCLRRNMQTTDAW